MEIAINKGKIILVLLGAATFVLCSGWLYFSTDAQSDNDSMTIKIMAIIGMVFFGLCFVVGVLKLFDTKPGLIINEEGILNNTSVLASQFISWKHITGFSELKIKSTRILLVYIDNPEEMISNVGVFSAFLFKQNNRLYGTPVSISATILNCNFDELTSAIKKYYPSSEGL